MGDQAIRVVRREREAAASDESAIVEALDTRPGAWLGCDVAVEGLYERHSVAFADPALAFYLDGATLRVVAFDPVGAHLLELVRPLARFEDIQGGLEAPLRAEGPGPHPALAVLRRFLACFAPPARELGLYGAFTFDYFRLDDTAGFPDDGRRRIALFFPQRVLVTDSRGARWVEFDFDGLPEAKPWQAPDLARARLEGEHDIPAGMHAQRVARGIERLKSGELVSLVLSQAFRRPQQAPASAAFTALRARNPYPAMFFLNLGGEEKIFGASPDVQVRADSVTVESAPVCGTVRRGSDPISDVDQALALLNSEKEAAALSGCADADCADKAKVCEPGSVTLVSHRRVHYFSTIVHTIAHTRGRRRNDVDGFDILLAHAAPATVAGVPKGQAVEAIAEIEGAWRGWYAGAAGRIATDGSIEAYTILRAAHLAGGMAEVRTGGNILVDSDPDAEEAESRLKAETLFRVLEGLPPASARAPAAQGATVLCANLLDRGDPFLLLLRNALAQARVEVDPNARVTVVASGPLAGTARRLAIPDERVLILGVAALEVLAADGVAVERYEVPRFARAACVARWDEAILPWDRNTQVGLYAAGAVTEASLRGGWRSIASSGDGRVLAAADEGRRRCAFLFRPESVLSLRGEAGAAALAAIVRWLGA